MSDNNSNSGFGEKIASGVLLEIVKLSLPFVGKIISDVKDNFEINKRIADADKELTYKLHSFVSVTKIFGLANPVPVEKLYVDIHLLTRCSKQTASSQENVLSMFDDESKIIGSLNGRISVDNIIKERKFFIESHKFLLLPKDSDWQRIRGAVHDSMLNKSYYSSRFFRKNIADVIGVTTEEEYLAIERAFEVTPRFIILGRPGSGKTTLLKRLALQCLNNENEKVRFPVFISLNQFSTLTTFKLIDFVVNEFRIFNFNSEEKLVHELLRNGSLILLLDGLDEVSVSEQKKVIYEIESLSRDFPNCPIITTCRVAFYSGELQNFTEAEIADFNINQIEFFCKNWFQNFEKSNSFISELKNNISAFDLATNPLLLSLLCIGYDDNMILRSNKAQIIEDSVDAIWKRSRGSFSSLKHLETGVSEVKGLIKKISVYLSERGRIFITKKEYLKLVADHFSERRSVNDFFNIDSQKLIDEIEGNTGIIFERAKNIYTFSHLSFQEYFFAGSVLAEKDSAEKLLKMCLTDSKYFETYLLTLQLHDNPSIFVDASLELLFDLAKKTEISRLYKNIVSDLKNCQISYSGDFFKYFSLLANSLFLRGGAAKEKWVTSCFESDNLISKYSVCLNIINGHKNAHDMSYISNLLYSVGVLSSVPFIKFDRTYHVVNPIVEDFKICLSLIRLIIDSFDILGVRVDEKIFHCVFTDSEFISLNLIKDFSSFNKGVLSF